LSILFWRESLSEEAAMAAIAEAPPLAARMLVVDDEPGMRDFLQIMLEKRGYEVVIAAAVGEARARLRETTFDVVITDLKMPGGSGLDVLAEAKEVDPSCVVFLMTAYGDTASAVEAMKLGAYDYLTKPFQVDEVALALRNGLELRRLAIENRCLREAAVHRGGLDRLVGVSLPMQALFDLVLRTASRDCTVLITGESGTGKELVAHAIHDHSARRSRPLVAINCGAIPETLLESELFGHEKGAFTGALAPKEGLFEVARGGTVFLDEIGETPSLIQVKLLRAIQERRIRRVGGLVDIPIDVRFLAATNRALEEEIREGRFRDDLYYRLNVIPIHLPPLRDRRDDIPLLVESFLARLVDGKSATVEPSFIRACLAHPWPGNVRELENAVERATILSPDGRLTADHLMAAGSAAEPVEPVLPEAGLDFEQWIARQERHLLVQALDRSNGVKSEAARLLHLSARSMRYLADKYKL